MLRIIAMLFPTKGRIFRPHRSVVSDDGHCLHRYNESNSWMYRFRLRVQVPFRERLCCPSTGASVRFATTAHISLQSVHCLIKTTSSNCSLFLTGIWRNHLRNSNQSVWIAQIDTRKNVLVTAVLETYRNQIGTGVSWRRYKCLLPINKTWEEKFRDECFEYWNSSINFTLWNSDSAYCVEE